jgi:hypothetical protein
MAALPLAFAPSLAPFIALLVGGFAIGVMGHIVRSRTAVAIGIGLVFLATVVLPLLVYGNPY